MPRTRVDQDNQEARFSDEDFSEWKVVTQERGQKITWGDGKGETKQFVGTFIGTEKVNISGDEDSDNPLDFAIAALFADSNGEKFWSWCPYAIQKAIDDGTIGSEDTVLIKYLGTVETKRGLNPVKTFEIRVKPR